MCRNFQVSIWSELIQQLQLLLLTLRATKSYTYVNDVIMHEHILEI